MSSENGAIEAQQGTAAKTSSRKKAAPRQPRAKKQRSPLDIPRWALVIVGLFGVVALLALVALLASRPSSELADPSDLTSIAVDALLFVGPLALFWALSRAMRLGLFWIFATVAWFAFGYLLIFIPPPPPEQAAAVHYALFLGLLTLALVALLTPPIYALGWSLFSQRMRRLDLGRAIRQAFLVAAYIVLLIGMNQLGVFNWLNALLLFVVFALAEFFFLARA